MGLAEALHALSESNQHFNKLFASEHNLISPMAWELQLGSVLNLSLDQLRFTLALFASVAVGAGIRPLRWPLARQLYALVTGVLLVYYPFGSGVAHVLPPALLTYLAMVLAPRSCGRLAWLINFPYLIWLHVTNASGESWNKGNMDFTGGEMVLVLKLISTAMCYQDSKSKSKDDLTEYQREHLLPRVPSVLSYLSYTFCLGNLLGGPSFEFVDYDDFINLKGLWDPSSTRPPPSPWGAGLLFVAQALGFMAIYLALVPNFGISALHSQWFAESHLVVKVLSLYVIGFTYQLRYFFTWKLSESSLTFAGLNFYWDEKSSRPAWGRCANAHFRAVQLADSARVIPVHWNIGTGVFLRRYVYERITAKGRKPHFGHLLFTQLVSGVWHGLYPGYILFFASTALWMQTSTVLYKAEMAWPPYVRGSLPWRAVKIFWTNFVLNYMAMAFMLLDLRTSLRCWQQVHFFPHIVMLAVVSLGPLLLALRRGGKGSGGKRKGAAAGGAAATDGAQAPQLAGKSAAVGVAKTD